MKDVNASVNSVVFSKRTCGQNTKNSQALILHKEISVDINRSPRIFLYKVDLPAVIPKFPLNLTCRPSIKGHI
jgi:hypothetical protein